MLSRQAQTALLGTRRRSPERLALQQEVDAIQQRILTLTLALIGGMWNSGHCMAPYGTMQCTIWPHLVQCNTLYGPNRRDVEFWCALCYRQIQSTNELTLIGG